MTNYITTEARDFADTREISCEIAQAILDMGGDSNRIWAEPTADEEAAVISAAWRIAPSDETELYWGGKHHRSVNAT